MLYRGKVTDGSITRRMRIACWIPKATDYTLSLRNTDCFFVTTVVARTQPNITFTYIACLVCFLCLSDNFLLLHLLRTLARVPVLLGKLSKLRYSSTKWIFFCNSASCFIPLSLIWNLRFRVTQSDSGTFIWRVFVLITRYFLRHFSHESIPKKICYTVCTSGLLINDNTS